MRPSCGGALAWGLLLVLPSIVQGFANTRMPLQLRDSRALSARAAPALVQIFVSAAHDDGLLRACIHGRSSKTRWLTVLSRYAAEGPGAVCPEDGAPEW